MIEKNVITEEIEVRMEPALPITKFGKMIIEVVKAEVETDLVRVVGGVKVEEGEAVVDVEVEEEENENSNENLATIERRSRLLIIFVLLFINKTYLKGLEYL